MVRRLCGFLCGLCVSSVEKAFQAAETDTWILGFISAGAWEFCTVHVGTRKLDLRAFSRTISRYVDVRSSSASNAKRTPSYVHVVLGSRICYFFSL